MGAQASQISVRGLPVALDNALPALPAAMAHALAEIEATYGGRARLKNKRLLKFGGNADVGTSQATIMTLPSGVLAETYPAAGTNPIDSISSADAGDTGAMYLEGHVDDGAGNLTFVVQTQTLQGQTRVPLDPPLARCTRAENRSAADLLDDVYVYQNTTLSGGVPVDTSKIHLIVPAIENQSMKAATAFGSTDYGILFGIYGSISKKQAASATIRLKIRRQGERFRTVLPPFSVVNGAPLVLPFDPPLIVPANADVIMTAEASTTGVEVFAGFNAYIATTGEI